MNTLRMPHERTLFIGGISLQTDSEMLRDYFSKFGTVSEVVIRRDERTFHLYGYGFVTFMEIETLPVVLATPFHFIDGKKVVVKPRIKPCSPNRVFVGGLNDEINEYDLRNCLSKFGKIEYVEVPFDPYTRQSRGYAFVTFDSHEAVDKVCSIRFHSIKGQEVQCKTSKRKRKVHIPILHSLVSSPSPIKAPAGNAATMRYLAMAPYISKYARLLTGCNISYSANASPENIAMGMGSRGTSHRYAPYNYPFSNPSFIPNPNAIPSSMPSQASMTYSFAPLVVDVPKFSDFNLSGDVPMFSDFNWSGDVPKFSDFNWSGDVPKFSDFNWSGDVPNFSDFNWSGFQNSLLIGSERQSAM